ncbi:MAG TPA: hypothetical protein VHL11_22270, partial [Phototrophicaceae bacterium]|nr:hypothetical protein [Phototrophicaceae bacterium]
MIACVLIPYFATAIERQQHPMLESIPLLLVKYGTKRSKTVAVSVEAAKTGAEAGMFLSRARGLSPTAQLVTFDEQRMQQLALDPLLRLLWDYTNRVEVDETAYPQTGVFYLDLGNLRDEDALYLGEKLQNAVQQQFHSSLSISVGLASGKFPAYVAASTRINQITLVPRRQEGTFVASCSTTLLPASKETARRLAILYVRQLGQFAALPREAVIAQFGREGKLLYALAQGLDG